MCHNEVFNIDCMEGMKEFPDNYFDLAVVDPPYGIGTFSRVTNSGLYKKSYEGNVINHEYLSESKWNNSIPNKEYFIELKRVSNRQIIWGANYYNCFTDLGGALIWYKNPGLVSQQSQAEIASISWKKQVDYIYIRKLNGFLVKDIQYIHPCEKPVRLYEWIFKNYANEGQKILDTHLGSGSSRIAAYNYKMDFTGYEIDKDYFEAAEKRFKNHISQLRIFEKKEFEAHMAQLKIF